MAGFVVVAVLMRPVGGWLSDRFGPIPVLAAGYAVVVVGAGVAATHPLLEHVGTVAFLAMAAALGLRQRRDVRADRQGHRPGSRVGGVTGLVGAAGGLGGFVPPLIMGYVYGRTDSYAIGLCAAVGHRGADPGAHPDRRAPHAPATRPTPSRVTAVGKSQHAPARRTA